MLGSQSFFGNGGNFNTSCLSPYALKLADPSLILVMIKHMDLISSLSIIKTGKHIGFHKTMERQILNLTESSSAYQNEIIKYITSQKKTAFEDDKFDRIATDEYLKLANKTKEKFKDNLQSMNKLSIHQKLLMDKMFDEFIGSL